VLADYALEPHHLRLLQLAAEAFDQAQAARQALEDHGALTVMDTSGAIKAHPCIAVLRDARLAFARLLRELDLDCGAPAEARPPGLRSNRNAR
jgi:phage terminase small subunit